MDRLSGTEYREAFAMAAEWVHAGDTAVPDWITGTPEAPAWIDAFVMFDPDEHGPEWPAAEINSPAVKRRWFQAVQAWASSEGDATPPTPDQFCRSVVTLTRADALEVRPRDWLVPNLIERESLAMLFGQPGCGKTFLALDWAARIATGATWRGQAVQSGPVIYVAAEGQSGLPRRLQAWQQHTGASLADAPLLVAGQPVDLADDYARERFADAVDQAGGELPAMLIVDTVARCFEGDESSNAAMGAFIRGCDDLRARWGSAVLLVHHSGHGRQDRARGASSLFGGLDAAYRLEQRPGGLVLACTKMKDFTEPEPIGLKLVTVGESAAIQVDADFDPDEAEQPPQSPRGKWQALGLAVAAELAADGPASVSAWRAECIDRGMPRRRAYKVFDALTETGAVNSTGDEFTLA